MRQAHRAVRAREFSGRRTPSSSAAKPLSSVERGDSRHERRASAPHATCIVVDDHPVVLGAVCDALAASGFSVVGRARTAAEGKTKIERRIPTVAVIDVRLRDGNGIDLTRELRRSVPETRIILYTGDGDAALLAEAFGAGARGVVLKNASLSDLVRAVETVVRGETYVDPAVERAR